MEERPKSIYRRGADNGMVLGLYFCVMFLSMALSGRVSLLGLLSSAMMFGVPFIIYYFLRKTYVEERGFTIYAALWMQGIIAFAGGGLFLAVMVYCYIRWIDTDFIANQVSMLIDVYGSVDNPRTREMVDIMRQIQSQGAYPSARDVVTQMELAIVFTGSILSMLMALLVRLRGVPKMK